MQTFNVSKQNGVELAESFTVALYDENIVWVKADGGDAAICYADQLDRRIKPKYYTVTNTYATVAGLIAGDKVEANVYNVADGTRTTFTFQQKFIREIREAYTTINGTNTACRKVTFIEGAFATHVVYVSDTLAYLSTAIVTTTTTTAAATTTTTAAATTTTTAAATTTTTAAATTTTTGA